MEKWKTTIVVSDLIKFMRQNKKLWIDFKRPEIINELKEIIDTDVKKENLHFDKNFNLVETEEEAKERCKKLFETYPDIHILYSDIPELSDKDRI